VANSQLARNLRRRPAHQSISERSTWGWLVAVRNEPEVPFAEIWATRALLLWCTPQAFVPGAQFGQAKSRVRPQMLTLSDLSALHSWHVSRILCSSLLPPFARGMM
jgi:hypothetical protein